MRVLVDPQQKLNDLNGRQYFLAFGHAIVKNLLFVFTNSLELSQQDQALLQVVTDIPNPLPLFQYLTSLHWRDGEFLSENACNRITFWIRVESFILAKCP